MYIEDKKAPPKPTAAGIGHGLQQQQENKSCA